MTQEVKILIISGVVSIALLAGVAFLLGGSSQKSGNTLGLVNTPADPKLLVRDDSYKIASDSAQVTIVEFGDYQCPACGVAYPVIKQVLLDYSGKVNFVFRNFPLPQHQNAQMAAEAAEAAGAQGKYWDMNAKLYEDQDKWSNSNQPLTIFTGYAQEIGLDTDKFQQDVSANKYADKIQRDITDGNALGVNSTPTFFVNGQKLAGVPSYNDFKSTIDANLKK